LHIVPPIALFLAKSPLISNYDLSSLRSIYVGAAPIGPELSKEVKERLNLKSVTQGNLIEFLQFIVAFVGYGLTESTLSFFRPTYSNDPPLSSGKLQGCMEAKLSYLMLHA
jgi:4-coumarate--CoA ligase